MLYKGDRLHENENYLHIIKKRRNISYNRDIQFDDIYLALWESSELPLVISCFDENKFEIIVKTLTTFNSVTRKFIILTEFIPGYDFGSYKVFRNLSELNRDDLLKHLKVSLQGRESVNHQQFLSANKSLMESITPSVLLEIVFNNLKIGNSMNTDKYLIRRYFRKVMVSLDIIREGDNCIIIVKPEEQKEFEELIYIYCLHERISKIDISFPRFEVGDGDIAKIIEKMNIAEPYHIFNWYSAYKPFPILEWRYSNMNMKIIPKYLADKIPLIPVLLIPNIKHYFVEASEALNYYKHSKITVLSNEAGMGKTVTLEKMAASCCPNVWVVYIDLSKQGDYIKKPMNSTQCIEFIHSLLDIYETHSTLREFFCQFFRQKLKDKEVLFFIDGYDVCETEASWLLDILKAFNNRIWLTTRPLKQRELESMYNVMHTTLSMLSKDDAQNMLYKILSGRGVNLTNENIENIISILTDELIGIPLYLTMAVEVVVAYGTEILNNLSIINLYEKFIALKVEKYHLLALKQLALCVFFSRSDLEKIINWEEFSSIRDAMLHNCENKKFILEGYSDGKPYFVHRTFAEYLCAKYFVDTVEWMAKNHKMAFKSMMEKLFHVDYYAVRKFFNTMLFEDLPLHKAILDDNIEKVQILLNDKSIELLGRTDRCGRTPLHVAASYGEYFPYEFPDDAEPQAHITSVVFFSRPEIRKNGEKIFEFLLGILQTTTSKEKLMNSSDEFSFSISDSAYKSGCLRNLNILCNYSHIELESPNSFFLCLCVHNSLNNLLEIVEFDCFCDVKFKKECLVSLAFKHCNFSVVKKIFEKVTCCKLRSMLNLRYLINEYNLLSFVCQRNDDDSDVEKLISFLVKNSARMIWEGSKCLSPLHVTVQLENINCLKILLKNGFSINALDDHRCTALHIACKHNSSSCVKELLRNKIRIDVADEFGNTALHYAAEFGNVDSLKELLKYGADINKTNNSGDTPLIVSAQYGKVDCLNQLLDEGADVNKKNKKGLSTLLISVCGNEQNVKNQKINDDVSFSFKMTLLWFLPESAMKIVSKLLEKGANINEPDRDGNTALMWAIKLIQWDMTDFLLQKGASIHKVNKSGGTALTFAIKNDKIELAIKLMTMGVSPDGKDELGNSNLILAFKNKNEKIVSELLTRNASVSDRYTDGSTCLHLALHSGFEKYVPVLIEKGVSLSSVDDLGNNALMVAIVKHQEESIDGMLKSQEIHTSLETVNLYHYTPLLLAVCGGFEKLALVLLKKGAYPNVTDSGGNSPLIIAVMKSMKKCVSDLLEKGANVNLENTNGETALMIATANNSASFIEIPHDIIDMLLEAGASIDLGDKDGNTPLMNVAKRGDKELIEMFLKKGAKRDKRNNRGETAYNIAFKHEKLGCLELLK